MNAPDLRKAPRMSADVGFVKLEEALEGTDWGDNEDVLEFVNNLTALLKELNDALDAADAQRSPMYGGDRGGDWK